MAATLQDFSGPDSVKQLKCNFLIKYETHVGLNHGPSQPVSHQFSQQSAVKQLKGNSAASACFALIFRKFSLIISLLQDPSTFRENPEFPAMSVGPALIFIEIELITPDLVQ